jgi:hypothetical protein
MRRFAMSNAESATETSTFDASDAKSLPASAFMTSSSELP